MATMTVRRERSGYTVTTAKGEVVTAQPVAAAARTLLVVRPTLAFDLTEEIAGMRDGETRTLEIPYEQRLRRLRAGAWR